MKAVCPRDQVAYDVKTGCPDCLARERDAYLARGVPDDDAVLAASQALWDGAVPGISSTLDALRELAERFKPARCRHDAWTYNIVQCVHICQLCGYHKHFAATDANGSPVDEEPDARFAPDMPIILGCKTQWKFAKTAPPPDLASIYRDGDSYYEWVAE